MKKILYSITTIILLCFLILKLLFDYYRIPSIYVSFAGLILTILYFIYFYKKYEIMNVKLRGLCLLILIFNSLITTAINASLEISDFVILNEKFMYLVIFAKWSYLLVNFYFVYKAYGAKKHRFLAIIYILVAYLNILEIFVNVEAILELLAVIFDSGLEKYGRINNIQKKIDK